MNHEKYSYSLVTSRHGFLFRQSVTRKAIIGVLVFASFITAIFIFIFSSSFSIDFENLLSLKQSVPLAFTVFTVDPCAGFDPFLPPENDPPGCWRAIKLRQIEAFPADFESSNWPKPQLQNDLALNKLKRCFINPSDLDCTPSTFVVVLAAWHYWNVAISEEGASGEVIWMKSQIAALRELGYTFLTAIPEYEHMVRTHALLPDVISIIWAEDQWTVSCLGDPRCLRDYTPRSGQDDVQAIEAIPEAERGTIPLWKLFSVTYWGANPQYNGYWDNPHGAKLYFNPLGQEWVIGPFPYPGHTHLPISIEKQCSSIPVVPAAERNHELLVLAKFTHYFQEGHAPTSHTWSLITNTTGLRIVSTAKKDAETSPELDPQVHSVGMLSIPEYESMVAHVKVMLGIGHPPISPSVYSALCQGVPVVMPYWGEVPVPEGWDLYDTGMLQHGPAAALGPPYVYSYRAEDEQDLLQAIEAAISTPIGRYIPPDMKWEALLAQVDKFMKTDWEARFREIMMRGWVEPEGMNNMLKHCREMNRCHTISAGTSS